MATDSSSDEFDHQDHYLDQDKRNLDASNDSESGFDSGSDSASNSEASSDSDDSRDEVSSPEVLTRNSRGIQLLASMLDLEASESHSSEDEDDDDDDDDDDLAEHTYEYPNSRQARRNHHQSFPKFALLPYELRQRIWEMFCPDLTAKSRVYEFRIVFQLANLPNNPLDVWESHILEQQTAPARVMSAVHRESREHVLKKFPDVLTFRKGRNTIRWDCKNDVVILGGKAPPPFWPIPGFSDQIRNLGLDVELGRFLDGHLLTQSERPEYEQYFKEFCPRLSRVFCVLDDADFPARVLRWCANRENRHYFVRTQEEEPGVGEDAEYMYCWRNPSKTREFAVDDSIPGSLGDFVFRSLDYTQTEGNDTENIFQPLIRFSYETGLRRFEKIVQKQNDNTDWSFSDNDLDDESVNEEPDEYESSGIDDSEISEDGGDTGSESGDDLVFVTDDSDQEEEEASSDEEQGPFFAARLAGFGNGPIEILDDSDDAFRSGDNVHHHPHLGPSDSARFSSMEPSDSSTMDHESSSPPRAGPSRSKGSGRKRVLESDSEQEEKHDGPPRKAARISNESRSRARATVVLSDDEDEDEQMGYESTTENRQSPGGSKAGEKPKDHVVISDDDEDEEEEEMVRRRRKQKARHHHNVVSDEEDDDEEDEEEVTRPKKIRSRRQLRPPASETDDDEDEDEEDESSTSDSYDSDSEDSSDEEDPPARPLTLAEKLDLHRRNNPIPDSDNDNDNDDDDGSVSGDDYDGGNYADFQDDEEGNEISGEDDDEDEDDEGGLIIDMADEEDEEDEDEY